MSVSVKHNREAIEIDEIVLQPQGRLDLSGGDSLKQQLTTLSTRRYRLWIVDMSRVEFVDSAGLVALVGSLNAAAQSDARLILCGLRPATRIVFEITQLDRAFTIFESYDAMRHALGRPQVVALPA